MHGCPLKQSLFTYSAIGNYEDVMALQSEHKYFYSDTLTITENWSLRTMVTDTTITITY